MRSFRIVILATCLVAGCDVDSTSHQEIYVQTVLESKKAGNAGAGSDLAAIAKKKFGVEPKEWGEIAEEAKKNGWTKEVIKRQQQR